MDASKELRCFIHGWRAYMWLQATKEKLDDIRDAGKKGVTGTGLERSPVLSRAGARGTSSTESSTTNVTLHGESLTQLAEQLNIDKATARLGFGNAISEIAANGCLGEDIERTTWTRWLENRQWDFNNAVNEERPSDAYDILMIVNNKVAETRDR